MKIGRNEPCPCGSGKKYKKCCLKAESNPAQAASMELEEAMRGHDFADLDEVNAFSQSFMAQKNRLPNDDFCGLSPEQMHFLLNNPFGKLDLLALYPDRVDSFSNAPIVYLCCALANALGTEGAKATATGCLPVAIVKLIAKEYAEHFPSPFRYLHRVSREGDFPELELMRLMMRDLGWLRKYRGRFLLTKAGHELFEEVASQESETAQLAQSDLYTRLLDYYCQTFNWQWFDGYPELYFIRQSFAFSLYLLNQFGGEFRDSGFYESAYLKAFPMLVDEIEECSYRTPEAQLASAYSARTFERCCWLFGLVELKRHKEPGYHYQIRRSQLFEQLIEMNLGA